MISKYEILIKSFIRFDSLKRLIDSIRDFYPDTVIRIADDSPTSDDNKGFPAEYLSDILLDEQNFLEHIKDVENIHYHKLSFDVGLSAGRNFLLDHCQSKYFVLMEDDFVVTHETRLDRLEKVITSNSSIVIAAGGTIDGGTNKRLRVGEIVKKGNLLFEQPYDKDAPREQVAGIECIPCRSTRNFFMGNLELFNKHDLRWQEELKIVTEHALFFYSIPKELKIYFVTDVWVSHPRVKPYCYRHFRNRIIYGD